MTGGREARIRQRAYELWEQAGRPHGRDQEHWFQATRQIDAESAPKGGRKAKSESQGEGGATPKRARAKANGGEAKKPAAAEAKPAKAKAKPAEAAKPEGAKARGGNGARRAKSPAQASS